MASETGHRKCGDVAFALLVLRANGAGLGSSASRSSSPVPVVPTQSGTINLIFVLAVALSAFSVWEEIRVNRFYGCFLASLFFFLFESGSSASQADF